MVEATKTPNSADAPLISPKKVNMAKVSPELKTFANDWRRYAMIGEPIVAVETPNPSETMDLLTAVATAEKMGDWPILVWHYTNGLVPRNEVGAISFEEIFMKPLREEMKAEIDAIINQNGNGNETEALIEKLLDQRRKMSTRNPADAIERCIEMPKNTKIFVCLAPRFFKLDEVVASLDFIRSIFCKNNRMVTLLGGSFRELPMELMGIPTLREPLPKSPAIRSIIVELFSDNKVELPPSEMVDKYSDALLGLTTNNIRTAIGFNLFKRESRENPANFLKSLGNSKRLQMNSKKGLSVWEGNENFSTAGGLEGLKKEFSTFMKASKTTAVVLIDEAEKQWVQTDTSGVSQKQNSILLSWLADNKVNGYTFYGPGGTGKTNFAKALAGEYGIPLALFSLAKMQGQFVGNSEEYLDDVLRTISALTDNRAVFIMTCNSMVTFPSEVVRRFKKGTFFFDFPTKEEREPIWNIFRKQYNIPKEEVNPNASGWTGAEIESCVQRAVENGVSLIEASKGIIPVSISKWEDNDKLRRSASGIYRSVSIPNAVYEYFPLPMKVVSGKEVKQEVSEAAPVRRILMDD